MDSLTTPLIPATNEYPIYRVYPKRFLILFLFAFLTFNQCMFWLTFSPIAKPTEEYYNITESTIDLLLNWGPIIFLPTLPLTYFLLNTHHGLYKCILIFAIVSVIATVIRLIPSFVYSPFHPNFKQFALPFLHIGQILIAATGPIGMALVSQLSCLWFASHERTRATTIAILGSSLGGAVAFLLSAHLVYEASRVPYLLYLHAGQALVAGILTLVFLPAEPPSPPSAAAQWLMARQIRQEPVMRMVKKSLFDTIHCFKDVSCVLLIVSGAIMGGTLAAWGGLFATILAPLGYTETQAGWFGFGQSIAGIVGAFGMGYLADQPRFQRSLKTLMTISLIFSLIFCLLFQLSIRTLFWPNHPPLPSSVASIGILLTIGGLFNGAGSPLIYECLAEIMHPLPESLTASIYVEFINIMSLVFLSIAPNQYLLMNLLVLLMMTVGIVMVLCARVTYKRKDHELRKAQPYTQIQNEPTET